MSLRFVVTVPALLSLLLLSSCSSPPRAAPLRSAAEERVRGWIRDQSCATSSDTFLSRFSEACSRARVVGLGETTHGQHECFETKRRITMHLIRERGFRRVGYEANGPSGHVANDFILGRTNDPDAAVGGLGMLIWMIEENRQLLLDLRAWNDRAPASEQVEIFGFDVQDPQGSAARLVELLEGDFPELAASARSLCDLLVRTREASFGGDREGLPTCREQLDAFLEAVSSRRAELVRQSGEAAAAEAIVRAKELVRFPIDPRDRGARDRGMAETVLDALAEDPEAKIVLWGHNGHITNGPLRWMGTEALGLGGHLRARLGDGYFALGVVFGRGNFQALDRDEEGRWWFRRYTHTVGPIGSLGRVFTDAGVGDSFLSLEPTTDPAVQAWLRAAHGARSWGGYGVPEAPDAVTRDAQTLMQIVPAVDFDGLLYLHATTAATPLNEARVWPTDETDGGH